MKTKKIYQLFVLFFIVANTSVKAQSLLDKLDKEFSNKPMLEIATFKTTRLGLLHSIETRKKGALEITLYNRYWNIPNFEGQRFLADAVSTRFGIDYAISDNFTFGAGYNNHDKVTDGYLKYKLLKQLKGSKKMPVSVTLVQTLSHRTSENSNGNLYAPTITTTNKFSFASQVLIARKLNTNLSLQVSPMFIHREASDTNNDSNNQFAIGFGGRHKIGAHASIVSEYIYVANPIKSFNTYNTFMFGVNWEVSDLMLQFHITNARSFAADTFVTQTTNNFNFKDGNLHFGVNATYIIHTRKKKLK